MNRRCVWSAALSLVLLFLLPALSVAGVGSVLPGTDLTIEPPPGWTRVPGPEGAVLALAPADGLAQIAVSVMQPSAGMAPDMFFTAMHDNVVQGLAADSANGWQSIEDRRQSLDGIAFRFRTFRATRGTATGMELGFAFARCGGRVVVFNVPMAAAGRATHAAAVRRCLLSLRVSGPKEELPAMPGVRGAGVRRAAASAGAGATMPGVRGSRGAGAGEPAKPFNDRTTMDELKQLEAVLMPLVEADPYGRQRQALATVRAGMGMLCYEQGEVRQAVDYLVNAVQLDAGKADVLELLGDVLDDLPEPGAPYLAQSYYEDALELEPANRACRLKLAALYMSTGALDDARVHYEILTRNAPGRPDPAYAQDLALCYLSLNRPGDAVRFFDEVARRSDDPRLRAFLAIFLNRQGDTRAAMAQARLVAAAADAELAAYGKRLLTDFRAGKGGN